VEASRIVFNREVCRVAEPAGRARFHAIAGLPLLKDVRNCEVAARGSLLQSREALRVTLYPRDSDAACRGSIAAVRWCIFAAEEDRGEGCQQLNQQPRN
jgi:hypothetical protein